MSDFSGAGDIDASLALLWGMHEPPTRGRKPTVTLDQIVTTAVEIADAEGLDAVSMRRIASELGLGTMSLYRHVPGKSELLDLMLDRVNAPRRPGSQGGWKARLRECAYGFYELYTSHPWLLQVDQSRPLLGPNTMAGLEAIMGGLSDLPMTDQHKMIVVISLDSLVTGIARQEINAVRAVERTGVTDEQFWAAQAPVLEKAMSSGDYPVMGALDEDTFNLTWEDTMDLAVSAFIDGLERRLER